MSRWRGSSQWWVEGGSGLLAKSRHPDPDHQTKWKTTLLNPHKIRPKRKLSMIQNNHCSDSNIYWKYSISCLDLQIFTGMHVEIIMSQSCFNLFSDFIFLFMFPWLVNLMKLAIWYQEQSAMTAQTSQLAANSVQILTRWCKFPILNKLFPTVCRIWHESQSLPRKLRLICQTAAFLLILCFNDSKYFIEVLFCLFCLVLLLFSVRCIVIFNCWNKRSCKNP